MRHLLPLLLLAAAAAPLAAFDLLDVSDVRVSGGAVGGDADLRPATGSASRVGLSGWRGGVDAAFGVDLLFVGVLGGAGVAVEERNGSGWEREASVGRVFAGPYLAVGPVNLELTGSLGKGRATLTRPDGASDAAGVDELGADLALIVGLPVFPVVVGATGGWLRTRSEHELPGGRVEVESDGWRAAAIVGWRF